MSSPVIVPSPVDLVDLDSVKNWLGLNLDNTDCDSVIQFLISSFGRYVLNKTGIDSFNSVGTYVEIYDGNGAQRMFLRNRPILTLTSVIVGAYGVPFSTGLTTSGVYIEPSQNSIAFRVSGGALMPPRGIYPYVFTPGQGNVQVSYTAGFKKVPEDLVEATIKAVSINYKRKDWIDLASKSMSVQGATGTTRYRDWNLPPEVKETLDFYSRYARP